MSSFPSFLSFFLSRAIIRYEEDFFFFRNLLFYKMKFQIVGIFPSFESSNFGEKEEEKES